MSKETVKSVHIQNFKSVVDLKLELGTFNVLIGENGCGKSNILEALAFGAAAKAEKLDYEFLGSRGVRVTNPDFMYSAFAKEKKERVIQISYKATNDRLGEYNYLLVNDPDNSKKWKDQSREVFDEASTWFMQPIISAKDEDASRKAIGNLFRADKFKIEVLKKLSNHLKQVIKDSEILNNYEELVRIILEYSVKNKLLNPGISNFIIYSPEQSSLRKFEETNQIYPLGIKGEGLFQYLKELGSDEKYNELLSSIKNNLMLLDWYESFDLPTESLKNDFTLNIRDKYLSPELQYFDQRSTNEGFLYLLFYSTLFLSKDTPVFFAIDNIDASLNPKLCMQLTRNLAELAEKNGKQVIVTTQNPAILDGLNLKDDNQRLFVVRRNDEGHTKATRVEYKAERRMKLSEVWTSGFIGGLPENF